LSTWDEKKMYNEGNKDNARRIRSGRGGIKKLAFASYPHPVEALKGD